MPNKRKLKIGAAAVLLLAIPLYLYIRYASSNSNHLVRVSGNIEVTDAEVSFKIPGKVAERFVSEGETVQAGQAVARLDSAELEQETALRSAEVQAAQAALAELEAGSRLEEIAQSEAAAHRAQSLLEELLSGSRPEEVAAAEAGVASAQAEADRWQSEWQRQQNLHEEGVISVQQLEATRAAHQTAQARLRQTLEQSKLVREGPRKEQIEQARAALQEARQRYALVQSGPRQETIAQARALLEQARQALAVSQTRLNYATLLSPLSGIVLSQNIEPGEYVAAGTPVITVGDLSNVWLRAFINETDLGRVKVGQPVRIRTDTNADKVYEGLVSFLAPQAEFTPKNVQTQQERVKLVYRVKIDIPNPLQELKAGMPADAEIQVGETAEQASRSQ